MGKQQKQDKTMSDTYNYNSGSPFGGMGGILGGGCGFGGFGGSLGDIIGLAIIAGIFGWGNNGWGGGFGGRGMMPGMVGGGDIPAITASLVGQQQVADRVASINTGVDAIAGIATANGVKLETVKDAVVNGFYANQTNLCQSFNNMSNQLTDMRFAAQQCCCDTKGLIESKFCNLTHQIERDKCDTLAAVRAEGEATRALMRDIQTQALQEKLAKAEAQLRDNAQTAAIVAAMQAQCGAPNYGRGGNCGCNPCGNLFCSVQNAFADEIAQRIINPTTTAAAA